VDIIINNLDDGAHPFHLHGQSFYVLTSHRSIHGWGSYNPYSVPPSSAVQHLNLLNPVKKDTVSVPRRGHVVIRFKADNEGIWMLHCHVLFHQASGMAMGIQIGGNEGHEKVDLSTQELCSGSS
jgi:FtsP/CotA-like multicopper oxidase with cupredoxin domain